MKSPVARFTRLLMLALMLVMATWQPAAAQDSDSGGGPSILRDTETELLFKDITRPMITAAGLDPNSVNVALLNDPEINAFVATGQTVYVQTGLLLAADNVNQLQGVIAHELGHVAGGHSIRLQQGANEATGITIATMVLGALAIAAGAGDAAMGIMMAGQQAAMTQVPRLHPDPGSVRRPGRGQISSWRGDQRQGPARVLREASEPGIPPRDLFQGQLRPHPPAVERAHPGARAELQGGSRLQQADRPGARGALRAGQSQALRLRRPQPRGAANIRKATRASPRIMRGLTPITSAATPTKPRRRRTLCSPPTPTTRSSSSSRARSCSRGASPRTPFRRCAKRCSGRATRR